MTDDEFAQAVEQYRPYWLRAAVSRTGNVADAEDAVQTALRKCYRRRARFRPGPRATVQTWVMKAVLRALSNQCRDAARRLRGEQGAAVASAEAHAQREARAELHTDLRDVLTQVADATSRAMARMILEGATLGTVAAAHGCTKETVKKRLQRHVYPVLRAALSPTRAPAGGVPAPSARRGRGGRRGRRLETVGSPPPSAA